MSTASHMQQVNVNVANSGSKNSHKQQLSQQQQQNGLGSGSGSSASTTPPSNQGGSACPGVANGTGGPVLGMAPQQQPPPSQSTSPPVNNAPKYGTLVPNRVFVGGISANTTEVELAQLFSAYGTVKATKIISDRAGVSKGYGFVTFESEEEAKRLQRESDNIMLRERRLNIAPAIKKQPFNRGFEVSSPPPAAAGQTQFYYAAAAAANAGVPYAYQNGMAYYTSAPPQTSGNSGELSAAQPLYQAPPVYATPTAAPPTAPYPMPMYPPQPLFVQHQYPYQPIPYDPQQYYTGGGGQGGGGNACPQYVYGGGGAAGGGGSTAAAVAHQQQCGAGGGAQGGGGGGGGQGGHGPVGSGSPTRAAYYHQHVAAYSADGMYYNVPMYNVAIDPTTGIYTTEGVDASIAGVSEAARIPADQSMAQGAPSHSYSNSTQMSPTVAQLSQLHGHSACRQSPGATSHDPAHLVHLRKVAQFGHAYSSHLVQRPASQNGFYSQQRAMPVYARSRGRCESNVCRTWSKKRRHYTETSSASSLRTNSNSSASAVDENLNEKTNLSPPPTPYSPLEGVASYHILDINSGVDLQVQQAGGGGGGGGCGGGGGGGYYQGGGGGRRNRRNNPRRQPGAGHASSASQPTQEVGGGDAPMPADVGEMCKKIDNLKL